MFIGIGEQQDLIREVIIELRAERVAEAARAGEAEQLYIPEPQPTMPSQDYLQRYHTTSASYQQLLP